jgi:alkylation response protein AidB-like acyl-CoA dehydrogenase
MAVQEQDLAVLLDELRHFMENRVFPLEARSEEGFFKIEPELDALRKEVQQKGWWLPQVEAEHGGMGLSLLQFARVSEVLGQSLIGHYVFGCQAPDAGNIEILLEHGTEEQKSLFLEPLLKGEIRSCFSMTEPENPGSNPLMLSTTAKKQAEEYVINGHKWFTTAADGAAFAIVMAVTDDQVENPYGKASMLIVPRETEGFEFVRNIPVMGDVGEGYLSHAELRYNNVRIPATYRLGPEGGGFMIAQQRLGPGRIHHCMRWIGLAERALDMMCKRVQARALTNDKVLASRQAIQYWIAESRAEIDASRLMVMDCARKIDEQGAYAARVEVSTIKFYVAGMLGRVLDRSVQAHGALGITDDLPLSSWYRHERAARIYDGPDEVHKARVAREILKNYR